MIKKEFVILTTIVFVAAFLRFYNLLHDAPFFFNPDERNMASAIAQFRLPLSPLQIPLCILQELTTYNVQPTTDNCNLNPHFFAYGQFPLYLAFASDQITKPIIHLFLPPQPASPTTYNLQLTTDFPSAIFYLRFWSALFSTFTVLLVYLITKKLFGDFQPGADPPLAEKKFEIGHYAAILAAFTPGLIQSAHFGTTESLLTFFFLTSIYLSISYLGNLGHLSNLKYFFLLPLSIGLSLGSKLTGIFFFVPPLISSIVRTIELIKKERESKRQLFFILFYSLFFVIVGSIIFFILSSPYNLKEPAHFLSAVFGYEKDVATGAYEAFYTRQFVDTFPLIFQAEKIFPYAVGWPVFILGTLGFLLMTLKQIIGIILIILRLNKKSKIKYQKYILKIKNFEVFNFSSVSFIFYFSFLTYFLPNAYLFAKWTRFMTPILPFFSIFAAFIISKIQKLNNSFVYLFICLFVITSILPGLMFMSIYTHQDTRVQASEWIYQNIPDNSYILSETANVVDIPLSLLSYNLQPTTYNLNVISFDFYHLDENPRLSPDLIAHLEKASYIFIPSRRIFVNYPRFPQKYPLVTKYYDLLFSGKLGFEKVAEISSFPQLTIGNYQFTMPDEKSEETYTVFDHPVIRIYRKAQPYTKNEYRSLFENGK